MLILIDAHIFYTNHQQIKVVTVQIFVWVLNIRNVLLSAHLSVDGT